MGKLAERIADARRSGVYRVEGTDALEEAVALNDFSLIRVDLTGASRRTIGSILDPLLEGGRDGQVLLFTGVEAFARDGRQDLERLVSALRERAAQSEAAGQRFFAAFLDPAGGLMSPPPGLPPLYNRRRLQGNGAALAASESLS